MSYGALMGQVADQAGGGTIWPSELEWTEYAAVLDRKYYEMGGEAAGYTRGQFLNYEVESRENHRCGERTVFQGRGLTICSKECQNQKGELIFQYRLALPEWAKLDIDAEHPDQNAGNAYPFSWRPATGNLMYFIS